MIEQRVYDYLVQKERGTVRPIPETFTFAQSDRPLSGRLIIPGVTPDHDPGLTFAQAGDRTDVAWVPPKQSTASRNVSLKSMRSVRGHMVDFERNKVLMFESILEFLFANMLLSRRHIKVVEDQPPQLTYVLDGKKQKHTFDFRATDVDCYRVAYQVKPADQLERDDTMRKVNAIKLQHIPRTAGHMVICTEMEITKAKGWNAYDVTEACRSRVEADCENVLEKLRGIGSKVEVWKLQDKLGSETTVWNAILCLMHDGLVQISDALQRFSDAAFVRAVPAR